MGHWVRQGLALAALFGGMALAYFWLGVPGGAGFAIGLCATVLSLGLASGYWVGFTPDADNMVTELMKWRRKKLSKE